VTSREKRRLGTRCKRVRGLVVGEGDDAIQMSGVLKLKSTYIDSLVAGRLFFFSLSAGGTSAQLETMSGKWERDIYVYICMHV